MIQLEVAGRRYSVPAGELVIGSSEECGVRLEDERVLGRHVIVQGLGSGVAIRLAEAGAEALVNGVRLGTDPTPVLHGDKVVVAGHEILVIDAGRIGSTQMMQAQPAAGPGAAAQRPGGASGPMIAGRLVCLTDGREYEIAATGLSFGRDASCTVVVGGTDVSRRHAEIRHTPEGYLLTDVSANGTFVNGDRVAGSRFLARGDVLKIGNDEFRFYAQQQPAPVVRASPTPPTGAEQRLNVTLHGVPATPVPFPAAVQAPPPLASLLVRSGTLRGKRIQIRTPVVNIGRADYNDIVLPDASVSTSHAKLQRREGVWVIVDLGSTNGTNVDGEAVEDEMPLTPGATLRVGEVTLLFEPKDAGIDAPSAGTRVMRKIDVEAPAAARVMATEPPPSPPPPPPPAPPPVAEKPAPAAAPVPATPSPRPVAMRPRTVVAGKPERGFPWWLLAVVVAAGGVAAYFYFRP